MATLGPRPRRLRLVEGDPGATPTPTPATPSPAPSTPTPTTPTTTTTTTPIPATVARAESTWLGGRDRAAPLDPDEAPPSAAFARGVAALPDGQLVALGARGDRQALEALYRRHAAFAIHLATRIEGSARDVEDVVHDAFLKAFERLDDLTDRNAFKAWLGSIVVHAVRSRMRRTRLMNLLGLGFLGRGAEPVDLDAIASPDASPHARAQIAQIYALLRTLAADERIAWTLRAVEGHDLETVARMTSCSLATVKRRIGRAQKFLDEHFVEATTRASQPDAREARASAPDAPQDDRSSTEPRDPSDARDTRSDTRKKTS